MAAYQKFNSFVEAMANKKHNLSSDVLKVMLTNTAPVAGNSVKADIAEIAAQNGYPAGGNVLTVTNAAQVGGVYTLVVVDSEFEASGGAFGPFQYIVIYNNTALNKELICFSDGGIPFTIVDTAKFIADFGADLFSLT